MGLEWDKLYKLGTEVAGLAGSLTGEPVCEGGPARPRPGPKLCESHRVHRPGVASEALVWRSQGCYNRRRRSGFSS
jgi:hypothetical protein